MLRQHDFINRLLDLVEADVEDQRGIAREIEKWDRLSLNSYLAEFPLHNDRLLRLKDYQKEGAMTEAQAARFRRIEFQHEEYKPYLDRIFQRLEELR